MNMHLSLNTYGFILRCPVAGYGLNFVDRQVRSTISDICVANPDSSHRSEVYACNLFASAPVDRWGVTVDQVRSVIHPNLSA